MTSSARNLAVLFADVSGSTTLYEKLGDRAALAAVETAIDVMKRSVAAYRGTVVKTIGDEVMAVFPDGDAALQAASDMQNRITALPPFGDVRLAIRIGFHVGEVLADSGDFFGDAVNTAARMAGFAKAGQIITTGGAVAGLSAMLRESTRKLAALSVKGKQSEVEVCEVLWQTGDDLTMLASNRGPAKVESVLRLMHGARTLVMDDKLPSVQIGRDATHEISIADRMASRLHGRIERRADRFYYVDLSTNGTFVTLEGDVETVVRRDQVLLRGRGTLSFGHSASAPDAELVTFASDIRPRSE